MDGFCVNKASVKIDASLLAQAENDSSRTDWGKPGKVGITAAATAKGAKAATVAREAKVAANGAARTSHGRSAHFLGTRHTQMPRNTSGKTETQASMAPEFD